MRLPPSLLTISSFFLVPATAAARSRRGKSAVTKGDRNSNMPATEQEPCVASKIRYLKKRMDADELRLKEIERKFWKLVRRANRLYMKSGSRVGVFSPNKKLSSDLAEIYGFIRISLYAFFNDFKKSYLYPGLLDEREGAGNRREKEYCPCHLKSL